LILEILDLPNTTKKFTGGVDGGRGWVGDVKNMFLNTSKIRSLGWKPALDSKAAIKKTIQLFEMNNSKLD